MLTPFTANSDSFFKITSWYTVIGGATATDLETTIVSVAGNVATLATTAATTVTSGSPSTCWYGLDDTAAFNTAIQAASSAWVSGPQNEVDVPNTGVYQVQNVPILSHVKLVPANGVVVRPSMPINNSLFLIGKQDGSGPSINASIVGTGWTADFTGVQAQKFSGTWIHRFTGVVYVTDATCFEVNGCTGVNLPADNIVQLTPTNANVNPLQGKISRITCSCSSGFGQAGYGTIQIDGGTAISLSDITSACIGRALNIELDDSGNGTRTVSGIVASNIRQVGSGAPVNQEALGVVAHANHIYDVTVSGVTATGGGCGATISYTPGGVGSVAGFTIDGIRVTGGGSGVMVDNNCVLTNSLISNGTFDGSTVINRSNNRPLATNIFTAGLTYKNCISTNGANSGLQSVFFDGSQGAVATGTATFTNCTSTNNGSGVLTTYGYENNYVQHVVLNGSTAAGSGAQTFGLYAGASTDATLNSCNITQTTGPGTITVH